MTFLWFRNDSEDILSFSMRARHCSKLRRPFGPRLPALIVTVIAGSLACRAERESRLLATPVRDASIAETGDALAHPDGAAADAENDRDAIRNGGAPDAAPQDAVAAVPDAEPQALDAGSIDLPCGPARPPFTGELPCIASACRVVSSTVFATRGCGNERPAVIVGPSGEPEVFYETSALGAGGWHATRSGGRWIAQPGPDYWRASFVLDSSGCGYAWMSVGQRMAVHGLYAFRGNNFVLLHEQYLDLPSGALALDGAGGVHAFGTGFMGAVEIDVTRANWIEEPVPGGSGFGFLPAALAIGPDGTHRVWIDARLPQLFFYGHGGASVPLSPTSTVTAYIEAPVAAIGLSISSIAVRPRVLFGDYMSRTLYLAAREDDASPFELHAIARPATAIGIAAASSGDAIGVGTNGVWGSGDGLFAIGYHQGAVSVVDLAVDIYPYGATSTLGPDGHLHVAVCANDDGLVHYYEIASD
jgi:hypothetical protein